VTDVAPFDQPQDIIIHQPTHGVSHPSGRNAHIVREPQNRKAQPGLALEAAVAEKMQVDRAVEDREFEPRRENVFQFFAHFYSIDFFVFHGFVLIGN
jgi:hypothetical protein